MGDTVAPTFTGLHHFAFTVRDLDASVALYQKVFQARLVQGRLPHYGREWTGYAELVIEPRTGLAIGLHHNVVNRDEEFDEGRTGLDHISLTVEGREGLVAWSDWLDSLGVAPGRRARPHGSPARVRWARGAAWPPAVWRRLSRVRRRSSRTRCSSA
ncbi:VOC family protein [Nonomuraea sp. NPDC050643]|uniref:VOC family protein n=1 Tax=Nonomuraea sp. NPDC050643 TaxID=3155660 RepID=UPI0033F1C2A9